MPDAPTQRANTTPSAEAQGTGVTGTELAAPCDICRKPTYYNGVCGQCRDAALAAILTRQNSTGIVAV